MFDYTETCGWMSGPEWKGWGKALSREIEEAFEVSRNGHLGLWQEVFRQFPGVGSCRLDLNSDWVSVIPASAPSEEVMHRIREGLMALMPWRKG